MHPFIEPMRTIAEAASHAILSVYAQKEIRSEQKEDNTPVTKADKISSEIIITGLSKLTPSIPVLSEEAAIPSFSERKTWKQYWCVDPLDGTKEFLHRTDEFTINIALIENHVPVLSLLYVPVEQTAYWAQVGHGAFCDNKKLQVRPAPSPLACLLSRFHNPAKVNARLPDNIPLELITCGSALKFARLAAGKGDLYLRLGPTCEWDTAAGQLLVEQAGGQVLDFNGNPMRYNEKDSLLNEPFVAIGDSNIDWKSFVEKCKAPR